MIMLKLIEAETTGAFGNTINIEGTAEEFKSN